MLSGLRATGKTHLTIAIAYRAIQNGYDAHFETAEPMIGCPSRAASREKPDSVLEEIGYLSHAAYAGKGTFACRVREILKELPILRITTNGSVS